MLVSPLIHAYFEIFLRLLGLSFLDGFRGRDLGSSTSADVRGKKTNSREVTIYYILTEASDL